MLNFDELQIVDVPVLIHHRPDRERYIIGYDPFEDQKIRPKLSGSGAATCNVFVIYDKMGMRITTTVVTQLPFMDWVNKYLSKEIDKRMFKISTKFIDGTTGRGQSVEAIRAAHQIRSESSERPDTTLPSE